MVRARCGAHAIMRFTLASGALRFSVSKERSMRARSSPLSLYSEDLVSMDKEGGFDATLSTGFIKTLSTRLKANVARGQLPGAPTTGTTTPV